MSRRASKRPFHCEGTAQSQCCGRRLYPARRNATARNGRRNSGGEWRQESFSSLQFFWTPHQGALDTSWMNGDAVSLLDTGRQIGRTQGRIFLTYLTHKGEHIGGELVSFLGASLVWHQRRQASLLESNLRLIKGGPREPEGRRRPAYRLSLALDPAQHLVFDLDEISGIEEIVGQ